MSHMSSRKLAAVLGASMLSLAAASVSAQTAPAAQDNAQQADTDANTPGDASKVIVVTGYARSLATALRAKRDSVAVIESLSAEDVGKLPDVSIADAISRLPGVAVQTQQGRGEMISIRGFSGDFTGRCSTIAKSRPSMTTAASITASCPATCSTASTSSKPPAPMCWAWVWRAPSI
jgi:iron complex outermembrane receptor protein